MICFASFHWHQKSLRVQGGQAGSYLAFNGSLKLGPRDGCSACSHAPAHMHTHTQTKECLKTSQDLALITPLPLYFTLFAHSPSLQPKSCSLWYIAKDCYWSISAILWLWLILGWSWICTQDSFFLYSTQAFLLVTTKPAFVLFMLHFYQTHIRNSCINTVIFMTFALTGKQQTLSLVAAPCCCFSGYW